MKGRIWKAGLAAGLLMSGAAQAALIDRGGGLIYDTVLNVTWLQDANYAQTSAYSATGLMTWSEANAWANQLNYAGTNGWRLPTALNGDGSGPCGGYNCTGSEMGHLYYVDGGLYAWQPITASATLDSLFINLQSYNYWSGTADLAGGAWRFRTLYGDQADEGQYFQFYAWAVHDGDVAGSAAPEPATLVLALAGLGLAGLVRRHRFLGAS